MSDPTMEEVAMECATVFGFSAVTFCGMGAFKETYKATLTDGSLVALKVVDRERINEVRTEREIEALKRCNTPRIAKLLDRRTHQTNNGKTYDIVIEEFLDAGSLEPRLSANSMTETQILHVAHGLALALKDLHPLHLVHRDIKPANVMFRTGSDDPVLVDFGLVRDLKQTSLTLSWLPHGPGTPFYAPPEQLNNDKTLIDWRSDQFAIGVLVGTALTGRHPYQSKGMSPTDAIYGVSERCEIAPEFIVAMKERGLDSLIRMVRQWPVQRYPHPDALIAAILN